MNKKIIFAILILIIVAIAVVFLFGAYLLPKIKPEGRPYHDVSIDKIKTYIEENKTDDPKIEESKTIVDDKILE